MVMKKYVICISNIYTYNTFLIQQELPMTKCPSVLDHTGILIGLMIVQKVGILIINANNHATTITQCVSG